MAIVSRQFKVNGQDYRIAVMLEAGKTREEVIRHYFPWVGKKEPFIFRANVGGGRSKKPLDDQYRLFLYSVSRTIGKMERAGWENPETMVEKRRWSSKDGVFVRWRQGYINDLIKEGIIDDPLKSLTPKIPKPGEVHPVDPEGRPLKSGKAKAEKVENPLYSQNDLEDMQSRLKEDGLLEWHDGNIDDDVRYGIEYSNDSVTGFRNKIAEWARNDDDNKLARIKISETDGKYEDDYTALIAERVEEEEPEPIVYKAPTRPENIDTFYERMMVARDFVISRELGGEYLDFVSTRAIKDGAKAIAYGISPDEVLTAVMKTWSADSKNEFERWERKWKPLPPTVNTKNYDLPWNGAHQYLGYVMVLAQARVPIFLVGPSGCGKSFMARDLAEAIDADYGELPLTAGATPSWLVGAETITGYKSRPFVDIYREGGVFCFEEMDAADPNMLLLVNNALANESFTNPVTGEEIEKSKKFIPVATANTWGLGANRQYTGRERLDAATLDRWRVGRVEMDYDEKVEKMIIRNMKELAAKREAKAKPRKAKR